MKDGNGWDLSHLVLEVLEKTIRWNSNDTYSCKTVAIEINKTFRTVNEIDDWSFNDEYSNSLILLPNQEKQC